PDGSGKARRGLRSDPGSRPEVRLGRAQRPSRRVRPQVHQVAGGSMRRLLIPMLLLAGCDMSTEEERAKKDHAAARATWCLVLKVDGADVRIPLSEMNLLLFKDEEYAKQH